MIPSIADRFAVLHILDEYYRSVPVADQSRDSLIDKILTHLKKFNPLFYDTYDVELILIYLRLLAFINKMTINVVGEFIYWYLEGGDQIR